MLEYITVALAVIAGITATVAYIYRRGLHDGIDTACEDRIKHQITNLSEELKTESDHGDRVHKEIFENVHKIDVKIEKLQSSTDVIKDLILQDHTKD